MEKCAFCGNFQNILKGSDHINPKNNDNKFLYNYDKAEFSICYRLTNLDNIHKNNKSLTAESAVKPR